MDCVAGAGVVGSVVSSGRIRGIYSYHLAPTFPRKAPLHSHPLLVVTILDSSSKVQCKCKEFFDRRAPRRPLNQTQQQETRVPMAGCASSHALDPNSTPRQGSFPLVVSQVVTSPPGEPQVRSRNPEPGAGVVGLSPEYDPEIVCDCVTEREPPRF